MISFTGAAIAAFVAASLLTLAILWPFRLGISLSAAEFFQIVDEREAEAGASVTESEALRELALRLEVNYDANRRHVEWRSRAAAARSRPRSEARYAAGLTKSPAAALSPIARSAPFRRTVNWPAAGSAARTSISLPGTRSWS